MTRHSDIRSFYENLLTLEDGPCVTWPFATTGGYGVWSKGGSNVYVHHLLAEIEHGPRPSPIHQVAHSCGKGKQGCVHPKHLRWATPKENSADRILHGTSGAGEENAAAKLTREKVSMIRRLAAIGVRQPIIGDIYGVTQSSVSQIVSRKTWANV